MKSNRILVALIGLMMSFGVFAQEKFTIAGGGGNWFALFRIVPPLVLPVLSPPPVTPSPASVGAWCTR